MDAVVKKFSREDELSRKPSKKEAEDAVRTLLRYIGEDPEREGLLDTPARVVKSYSELFSGYDKSADEALGRTFEEVSGYDDIVLVKDIPFFSHCEHHMVPIIGKAHVAYLPDGRVLGLSKIARTVDVFAKRLQTQESMTAQIARAIDETLAPRGVAVLIEADHMCMAMRGVKKLRSSTLTTTFTGMFKDNPAEQARFMTMLRGFSSGGFLSWSMALDFNMPSPDKQVLEEGSAFTPRFDANGLITAVVTDAKDNALLMVAHMNAEALSLTLETGIAHYFSRSRRQIWKKGETSGNLQTVVELLTDCDQDALLLKVTVAGHDATCHTGRRSCFYRQVTLTDGEATLRISDDHRHFVPQDIYKP